MSTNSSALKPKRGIRRWLERKRLERVEGALKNFKTEISALPPGEEPDSEEIIKKVIDDLLAEALSDLNGNSRPNIDQAWRRYNLAKRLPIFYYSKTDCRVLTMQLQQEAPKLKKWREETILKIAEQILDENNKLTLDQQRKFLFSAVELRDEHYENVYFKIAVRQGYLVAVTWILFFTIVGAITSLVLWRQTGLGLGFLLTISALGAMGAIFSIAYTATKSSVEARIPDQMLGSFIAWLRTLTGIGAALAIFIILDAGLEIKINGAGLASDQAFLPLAFVAGFSERLIINAVNLIASERKDN